MDSGSCDHRLGGRSIRSWIVGHVITDWVGDALDHGWGSCDHGFGCECI